MGSFAVRPAELAAGKPAALFRLFVGLSMFQARRDTVIMAQQRAMTRAEARSLTSPVRLQQAIRASPCEHLRSADAFEERCDVRLAASGHRATTCLHLPDADCHVKDASSVLHRMADLGKLPTSAWLRLWSGGRLEAELDQVLAAESDPRRRADRLVELFRGVYRVGPKLATMFVSALSTPALAPGLTPWHPAVDGSSLVVVDTNVARVVDALRGPAAKRTYEARATWVGSRAAQIDLRRFRDELPRQSARLVQQALYLFGSKSNRVAQGDPCARIGECAGCPRRACPFARPRAKD